MKKLIFAVFFLVFISGCATKSQFTYDPIVAPETTGTIVAVMTPVVDSRQDEKEIDKFYENDPAQEVQLILLKELMSTGLFKEVVAVENISDEPDAEFFIEPTMYKLEWMVPGHDAMVTKAFVTSMLTGGVGGVIYGSTKTDVFGETNLHLKITEAKTGNVLLEKNYTGKHQEKMAKISCDTPGTRTMMVGKSLKFAVEEIKNDLGELLGDQNTKLTMQQKQLTNQPDGKYVCAKLKRENKLRWVTQVRVAAGYREPLEGK